MLAPYVRFVLIDRTMEDIQAARARYGLSEAQCVCVDLRFWEIYEEEERFFETLLANGDDLHLSEYLRQVMESVAAQQPTYAGYEKAFDFSVVCGLASQLNARFAGLLQLYGKDLRRLPRTAAMMKEMNVQAAGRLMDAIMVTTSGAVFAANEICARRTAGRICSDLDGGMGTASDSKDRNTDSARGCRRHYLSGCRQPGI